MTRRERLEAKLEKRAVWATSRRAKSDASYAAAMAVPMAPFGEPIKVGHHSEKRHRASFEKFDGKMRQAFAHSDMANHHESKAEGLAAQLDGAIFSDDHNATEALEARIAEREAERDRIKAYNASCRKAKGPGDESLLDDAQRAELESVRRVCPYQLGPYGSYPAYSLSNLSGRIKADRDRLAAVKARQARAEKAEASGGVSIEKGADWCRITFSEKPERSVIDALKAAGFRWGAGSWSGPIAKIPAGIA